MIVKVFPSKGGGSGGSMIDYLCGKDREREQARVLRGNPDETLQIIQSLNFSENYFAGCLSFEEKDIDEKTKIELMNSFEECLFTGLDANQWNCLWVEHKDKGRLELNFVVPKVELTTGRALNPYWKDQDFNRVDLWKDIQNEKQGFTNPNDPTKRRELIVPRFEPQNRQEQKEILTEYLKTKIEAGEISYELGNGYRRGMVKAIEELGLEVTRQGKDYISVKDPNDPNSKNLRLKGAIYEQGYYLGRESKRADSERETAVRTRLSRSDDCLREMEDRYTRMLDAKRNFHIERYIQTKPRSRKNNQHEDQRTESQYNDLRSECLYDRGDTLGDSRSSVSGDNSSVFRGDLDKERRTGQVENRDSLRRENLVNNGRQNQRDIYNGVQYRNEREADISTLCGSRANLLQQAMGRKDERFADFTHTTTEKEITDDRDRTNIVRYAESVRSTVQQSDERIRKHNGSIRSIGQTSNAVRARKPINERFRATVERLKQTLDQFRSVFSEFQETVRRRVNQIIESRQPKAPSHSRSRDDGHGMSL